MFVADLHNDVLQRAIIGQDIITHSNQGHTDIDRLIENGVYFDQHISVSDGSYTCMGAVFTSQYPFQSGITTVSAYSQSNQAVCMGFPAPGKQ